MLKQILESKKLPKIQDISHKKRFFGAVKITIFSTNGLEIAVQTTEYKLKFRRT